MNSIFITMSRLSCAALASLLRFLLPLSFAVSLSSVSATTILLVNNDGLNEGFNSSAQPFVNQTGNTGTTLGQQRLNVFQAAADYWAARVDSSVVIRIAINFDPLSCDAGSAILGSAGPEQVFRNFPNAPLANTWYVEAVANSYNGSDISPSTNDVATRFNSSIDNNNSCLNGTNWWLGIDSPAPGGTISLFDTVLHEIGHGIGFLSLVSQAGSRFGNIDDAYSINLFDQQTNKSWQSMTDNERAASAINGPNLTWSGPASSNSSHLDASVSRTNGSIRMFAPNPYQSGSSVSHWDTSLSPDELMEPSATPTSDDRATIELLRDVGWRILNGSGEFSFTTQNFSVFEDLGPATIGVSRSGGSQGAVSVTVTTSDLTAMAGLDYTAVSQTLNWADSELGIKTLQIPVVDDGLEEQPGQTVNLMLSNATNGATISTQSTATLVINDPFVADENDDFLLTVMPPILAASAKLDPVVNPKWSIASELCCPTVSATFQLSQGADSRSSITSLCSAGVSQSSEVESTQGSKVFSFSLNASGCGVLGGSFNFQLKNKSRYVFVPQFVSDAVDVAVFSGPIKNTVSATSKSVGSANLMDGLDYQQTIRLSDTLEGDSSFQSVTGLYQTVDNE